MRAHKKKKIFIHRLIWCPLDSFAHVKFHRNKDERGIVLARKKRKKSFWSKRNDFPFRFHAYRISCRCFGATTMLGCDQCDVGWTVNHCFFVMIRPNKRKAYLKSEINRESWVKMSFICNKFELSTMTEWISLGGWCATESYFEMDDLYLFNFQVYLVMECGRGCLPICSLVISNPSRFNCMCVCVCAVWRARLPTWTVQVICSPCILLLIWQLEAINHCWSLVSLFCVENAKAKNIVENTYATECHRSSSRSSRRRSWESIEGDRVNASIKYIIRNNVVYWTTEPHSLWEWWLIHFSNLCGDWLLRSRTIIIGANISTRFYLYAS